VNEDSYVILYYKMKNTSLEIRRQRQDLLYAYKVASDLVYNAASESFAPVEMETRYRLHNYSP